VISAKAKKANSYVCAPICTYLINSVVISFYQQVSTTIRSFSICRAMTLLTAVIVMFADSGGAMPGVHSKSAKIRQRFQGKLADAVEVEPVSASKFPANREIYREFCRI
jgi:hypothetical protein